MKDFFELLVKDYGLPAFFASYLMLCAYILVICYTVFKVLRSFYRGRIDRIIKREMDQDLHPYFTHEEIVSYTRYYVPQYFQNITPSEGDELNSTHAAAARSRLMPEFLKKGLLTKSSIKYFIILSDTGMGKTAFLINLYRKYKTLQSSRDRIIYHMRLFPLGAKDALEKIRLLENKKDTILLLDAFDEDIRAVADYKARMLEILEVVKDFRKVIFTCRTQFFPNKDEEPTDTNDITFGENRQHAIHKLYLSAFDERDILNYLLLKYEFAFYRLYRAYQLVRKCPSLMFRPMLLTYIDDLLAGRATYSYSYEMYQVMIQKWVDREALKPAVRGRHTGRYTYQEKLWQFSYQLAVNLYEERETRQGYTITIDDLKKLLGNRSISSDVLSLGDSTGRSLLNRNSLGQFKFAHKSILEFLLAHYMFYHPELLSEFDFHGMDATQNFLQEMLTAMLKGNEGRLVLTDDPKPKNLSTLQPVQIKKIKQLVIYETAPHIHPEYFAGLTTVAQIIYSNPDLLVLYIIYLYVLLYKRDPAQFGQGPIVDAYNEVPRDILQELKELDAAYIQILLEHNTMDKNAKTTFHELLAAIESGQATVAELDTFKSAVVRGRSERAIVLEAYEEFKKWKKVKAYLPGVQVIF